MEQKNIDGIVLVDKPKGWTSFDVVAKIRNQLRNEAGLRAVQPEAAQGAREEQTEPYQNTVKGVPQQGNAAMAQKPAQVTGSAGRQVRAVRRPKVKVGHTGTLDPMATGLLIIVTGTYCKRAQEFSKLDKVYEAELTLGVTSDTDDDEGEKSAVSDHIPDEKSVLAALQAFTGEIEQVPPVYSAIKIGGQRAYKQARKGQEVVMEPRKVTIYEISDVEYAFPKLRFSVKVSSGTYIRSLARDIGAHLGTGAYLSALRRTEVGEHKLADATTVENFNPARIQPA